jgi:hypothetical protein
MSNPEPPPAASDVKAVEAPEKSEAELAAERLQQMEAAEKLLKELMAGADEVLQITATSKLGAFKPTRVLARVCPVPTSL